MGDQVRVEEPVLRAQVGPELVRADQIVADSHQVRRAEFGGADHRIGTQVLLPVGAQALSREYQVRCPSIIHLRSECGALVGIVDRYLRVVDPGCGDEPLGFRDRRSRLAGQPDHHERFHRDPVLLAVADAVVVLCHGGLLVDPVEDLLRP